MVLWATATTDFIFLNIPYMIIRVQDGSSSIFFIGAMLSILRPIETWRPFITLHWKLCRRHRSGRCIPRNDGTVQVSDSYNFRIDTCSSEPAPNGGSRSAAASINLALCHGPFISVFFACPCATLQLNVSGLQNSPQTGGGPPFLLFLEFALTSRTGINLLTSKCF